MPSAKALHLQSNGGNQSDMIDQSDGVASGTDSMLAERNRYERVVAHDGDIGTLIADISRQARSDQSFDEDRKVFDEVGVSIGGQGTLAFLLWVRERCLALGIKQIAFLARDGELPYKMALAMPEGYWDGISLHYIHINRKTSVLAGMAALGLDAWRKVGTHDEFAFLEYARFEAKIKRVLERAGLTQRDLPNAHPLKNIDPDALLTPDLDEAWQGLLDIPEVAELVMGRATTRLELIEAYLSSSGLKREEIALVDVGWRGQTATVTTGVFENYTGRKPLNLHFGGFGTQPEIDRLFRIERFAFDDSRELVRLDALPFCVELFTSAGQPRATDYRLEEDETVPVLDDGVPAIASREVDWLWDAAIRMASLMPVFDAYEIGYSGKKVPRASIAKIFWLFWERPDVREAAAIGRMKFENDYATDELPAIATAYTLGELTGKTEKLNRCWRSGSAALTAQPLKCALIVRHRLLGMIKMAKWTIKNLIGR